MKNKIPISEIFESLQGEGPKIGSPSLFIRFAGCPVKCSWCDSKFSWKGGQIWTSENLYDKLFKTEIDDIVFTGGEPLLYYKIISEWVEELKIAGKRVYMETSGITGSEHLDRYKLASLIRYVTWILSPKDHVPMAQYEWLRHFRFDDIYWKFVWSGWEETKDFITNFFKYIEKPLYERIESHTVFVMPKGITNKEVMSCSKEVWAFCQEFKLRFSPRLQVNVWGRKRKI